MMPKLSHYEKIVGKNVVNKIRNDAEPLAGKHFLHLNATAIGGGVAEILNTLVFLMNDVGLTTGWRLLIGSQSFFKVTKQLHNGLQGKEEIISAPERRVYLDYCKRNAVVNHIKDHDVVVFHDPQTVGMAQLYDKKKTWFWRCHIDISEPDRKIMGFLLPYIRKYDSVIISSPKFRIKNFSKPQEIIHPSIDPLSHKNKLISHDKAKQLLQKKDIDVDKPIISQVSRFDPWKDHIDVIKMYEKIRRKVDCQLVLMGNMASDDPEGPKVYHKVKKLADKVGGVKLITEQNDLLVNALQQESKFVFQNSIKEGFALTVSEAMWKYTPVLGTAVGGIPEQVIDGKTGLIIKNHEEGHMDGVKKGILMLEDRKLRERLGKQAHEHVKKNFLITRHLQDYINLFRKYCG
ncbi:glycosyltransferase [Candidatus Woesearchaeota archaeon]|nr:glycosyltransferase [Candidatus Woesearchaeota archaeon]